MCAQVSPTHTGHVLGVGIHLLYPTSGVTYNRDHALNHMEPEIATTLTTKRFPNTQFWGGWGALAEIPLEWATWLLIQDNWSLSWARFAPELS